MKLEVFISTSYFFVVDTNTHLFYLPLATLISRILAKLLFVHFIISRCHNCTVFQLFHCSAANLFYCNFPVIVYFLLFHFLTVKRCYKSVKEILYDSFNRNMVYRCMAVRECLCVCVCARVCLFIESLCVCARICIDVHINLFK